MIDDKGFFAYARERYHILNRREVCESPPWSRDPIFQQYRFCNVFREDDKTTQWIRSNIPPDGYGDSLVGAMIIARWFNRIETLEKMLPPGTSAPPYFLENLFFCWDDLDHWERLMRDRLTGLKPLVTGAYMIKTPAKMNKLDGLLQCLRIVLTDAKDLHRIFSMPGTTLQCSTDVLAGYPYLGPFMAYEVITDLRHSILSEAPDIMTWANPGPGAFRGAGRVFNFDAKYYSRGSKVDYEAVQQIMRELLYSSQLSEFWPDTWPSWEMRDVEHTLCEWDKYERARLGQGRPKQRYSAT